MNKQILFLTLIFLGLHCAKIQAQKKISLAKAIEIGLSKNFDVEIAALQEKKAIGNREIGVSDRFPSINLGLSQRNRASVDNSPTSFLGGSYSNSEIVAKADLDWILFDGYQVRINKSRLSLLERQSIGQTRLVIENTIEAIILSYYRAAIEQGKLEVLGEIRALSREKYQKASNENKFGDLSQYELNNFQNALLTDSLNYHSQEIILDQALVKLAFLIGDQSQEKYVLTEKIDLNYRARNYDLEKLERMLVNSNQDIKNQYTNLKLQENAIQLTKAQRKPIIALRSGISQELGSSKFTGEERNNGGIFDFYINFSLSYQVFDGGRLKQRLQEAKIDELIANQQIEKIKSTVLEKMRTKYDGYDRQSKLLNLHRQLIRNLTSNTEIALSRVESGYSPFIEYRGLQIDLLEAKFNLLETIFDLKIAETEITRLTGGITRTSY